MRKLFATILIFSSLAQAAEQDSVALRAGDKAPFDGILLSIPRAERVRLMDIDLTTCTKVSDLKDQEIKIIETRLNNANAEIDRLSTRLAKEKGNDFWSQVGMFLLGAAATTAIAYGVSQATSR